MDFRDFLKSRFEWLQAGEVKSPVSSISAHSERVKPGGLFIALKGRRSDGHEYLSQAVQRGAGVLLVEDPQKIPTQFKGMALKYNRAEAFLPLILNKFYDFPSRKLLLFAVTGSNGKTSFCYLLEWILQAAGLPTGLIGTVEQRFKHLRRPSSLTTPEPTELFERIDEFVRLGAKALVMEVSSIALDQNRTKGLDFDSTVWTNLSQDHLDYHQNMEDYFQAKASFFTERESGIETGVKTGKQTSAEIEREIGKESGTEPINGKKAPFRLINGDDEYGRRLIKNLKGKCWAYGQSQHLDICFKIKNLSSSHSLFDLKSPFGKGEFLLPLPGLYNVYNAVASLACALQKGFSIETCAAALKSFPGLPGRLQKVSPPEAVFKLFVDYAHSPSALSSVLQTLKQQTKNRLMVVFGCGGDRDRGKRAWMTAEALQIADLVFLTTDNPRFEDPLQIIEDGMKNVSARDRKRITVELDRKSAIQAAIQAAQPGDIVLIAGKGHEKVQIIGAQKLPFSDIEVARQALLKQKL